MAATADLSRITFEDARPAAARKTHTADFVACERWYGDSTIETCVPADLAAGSPAVAVNTGVHMSLGGGPDSGRMQLQIAGEINGKPFSVIRWFSHADIDRRRSMVDRCPIYHERLRALVDRAADEVVAVAFPQPAAQ